ncbi:hypothetical protein BTR14_15330 [Rhizobium rhizosphaerae]|uniref:Nudix hydrolase domain-containing protein n=1 Tax=Xaviernesmea rhizosphaerae TaxID=1672749 RepID=A0ABX3PAT9_9HYPH|nr:NUDIX domain-containing protein [Xaviernesmea rhizosphaerae]OQP85556.1 hypothetical protein BTR14_15330 [Xaviernesmea rhizosphaerae]
MSNGSTDAEETARLPQESAAVARPAGVAARLKPRDAASLILLDRSTTPLRVLVGRRATRHVFMPGLHVFPGGRRDAADLRQPLARPLPAQVQERLLAALGPRGSGRLAQAIAIAALRELKEETGLCIGRLLPGEGPAPVEGGARKSATNSRPGLGFLPDAANLRYIARAVTPPGHVRRYDTHFFAAFADEVGLSGQAARDSHELEELQWLALNMAHMVPMADITRIILADLEQRLAADPALALASPIPFYHSQRGRLVRDLM